MANTFKDIIITPNRSSSSVDPKIEFRGGNVAINTAITAVVYPESNGTLSFEGSAGQLFSITNDLTGTIFSVNDISGLPAIEVDANSNIVLNQYTGNVSIGSTNTNVAKLHVVGTANITSNVVVNGSTLFVDAVGNEVGIGTSNPTANLHVIGNTLISQDLTVSGNLYVEGNTISLNVSTLEIEDNDIVLNANTTGAPTLNASITVDRGSSTNTFLRWNEATDKWGWSDDGTTHYPFSLMLDAYGAANNRVLKAGDTMTGNLIMSGSTVNVATINANTIVSGTTLTLSTGTASNGNIVLSANGTEYMRITNTGFVGIGATNPLDELTINSLTGGSTGVALQRGGTKIASLEIGSSSNTFAIRSEGTAGIMTFTTVSTERMRIDETGNVGIGTTTVQYPLHVLNSNTSIAAFRNSSAANTQILIGHSSGDLTLRTLSTGDSFIFSDTNKYLALGTGATERMRIDSTGNVVIGSTTATARLHSVVNSLSTGLVGLFEQNFNTPGNTTPVVRISRGNNQVNPAASGAGLHIVEHASNFVIHTQDHNANSLFSVLGNGNVGIGTTNPSNRLEVNGAIAFTNTTGSVISSQFGNSFTTSAVTSYTVDTFASATFRSAKYFAQMAATTGPTYGVIELSLVHDGTTVYLTQYGETKSNASANLGVFDASITGGALNITFTPGSVYAAQTVKVSRLAITA